MRILDLEQLVDHPHIFIIAVPFFIFVIVAAIDFVRDFKEIKHNGRSERI